MLSLLGPRIATMFFLQVFFIAHDNLASRLGEGAVTALNYGWFIMQVPETLIGSAIAIALLPTLSEIYARQQMDDFRQTIHNALRVLLALTIPVAALLSVAIRPLVGGLFGFEAADVELVVWATRAYLLGLMGHALLETAARSFYAQQDARTPLFVAAINAAAYILFAVLLSPILGAPGIALANTLAFTGEALLLLYLLNRRLPGLLHLGKPLLRILLVSAAGALLVFALMRLPLPELPLAFAALAVGGLAVLPFILPEIKLLIKL